MFTLGEIAERIGGEVHGDASVPISGVAPIRTAHEGQISFVANSRYERFVSTTQASALVIGPEFKSDRLPIIFHENPYLAFALVVDLFFPDRQIVPVGIHKTAFIDDTAEIDATTAVGPLCHVGGKSRLGRHSQLVSSVYIGENTSVGENCLLYPGVRILEGTVIGNNVILHPGVVVGSDGFGFAPSPSGFKKVKQVGWVEIGDDVEIGSNTTIDRGALGPTRIGRGTKIDNLVQIAHNVEIGENCIIVSQAGISGSTRLGNGVVLAGQAGLVGHLEIGDGVTICAQSGVSKSVPSGKTLLGSPARDIVKSKRIESGLRHLPELLKRVKALEKKLGH